MELLERLENWIAGVLIGAITGGLAVWRAMGRMIDARVKPVADQAERNRKDIHGLRDDMRRTVKDSEDRIMAAVHEVQKDVRESWKK